MAAAALLVLMPALTVAVVVAPPVPGAEDACPSARQVGDAMQARFSGSLIAPDSAATTRPDALRSVLDVAGDGTVVRFALVDARGETQLRRTLPAPGRGRPVSECLALADTLAVIVERYLAGIAYDAADTLLPAPPATAVEQAPSAVAPPVEPGRGVLALVGLGWRTPRGAGGEQGEVEARVGAQVELTRATPRLSLAVSAGISPPAESQVDPNDNRIVTFRRFPFRLGALLAVPAGPGWVEPTVELAADLFVASAPRGRTVEASQDMAVGFGLQAAVGYRLKIAGPLYLRPRASIGVAVRGTEVRVPDAPEALFTTPRGYASFGIDTGVLFR